MPRQPRAKKKMGQNISVKLGCSQPVSRVPGFDLEGRGVSCEGWKLGGGVKGMTWRKDRSCLQNGGGKNIEETTC